MVTSVKCPKCGLVQMARPSCRACGEVLGEAGPRRADPRQSAPQASSPLEVSEKRNAFPSGPRPIFVLTGRHALFALCGILTLFILWFLLRAKETATITTSSGLPPSPVTAPSQPPRLSEAPARGDIVGDVFVRMKSGDVKRLADLQIALIDPNPDFQTNWDRLLADFTTAYDSVERDLREADARRDEAWKRLRAASILTDDYTAKNRAWEAASQDTIAAGGRVDEVVQGYRARAMRLAIEHAVITARTDVNGHYEARGLPHRKYYVLAESKVYDQPVRWMVPVDLKTSVAKMDLSNSNAGFPFNYRD